MFSVGRSVGCQNVKAIDTTQLVLIDIIVHKTITKSSILNSCTNKQTFVDLNAVIRNNVP